MRAHRPRSTRFAPLLAALLFATASPASALDLSWEGSAAEKVTSSVLDLVFVRPLATGRLIIGAGLFVPAAFFSLPMGKEGYDGAFDTLIAEPKEYAFDRKIGEF